MAYEQVIELRADKYINLGGVDKKSGKANPTSVEGYYLGSFQTKGGAYGPSTVHVLQTKTGNVGVWERGNLADLMAKITPGNACIITFRGMSEKKPGKNQAYLCKAVQDKDNTIDVSGITGPGEEDNSFTGGDESDAGFSVEDGYEPEAELGDEEAPLDEAPVQRPVAPARRAAAPDPQRAAKVQALLKGRSRSA